MVSVLVAMVVIVLLAALVVVYVAFPHRGAEVPNAPWVGEAMRKGVNLLPTLDNLDEREQERAQGRVQERAQERAQGREPAHAARTSPRH